MFVLMLFAGALWLMDNHAGLGIVALLFALGNQWLVSHRFRVITLSGKAGDANGS